jgi:hypothetical protein
LFFGQNTDAQTENLDSSMTNDTIRIANDTLEYEVIIIDPGLVLGLRQDLYHYHSQSYLENKNILWVGEWNRRVLQPFRYNLYEMTINYNQNIDYGYEVNYLIYNYMVFSKPINKNFWLCSSKIMLLYL